MLFALNPRINRRARQNRNVSCVSDRRLVSTGTRKTRKRPLGRRWVTWRRLAVRVYRAEPPQKASVFSRGVVNNILSPVCPAAVLWCSGSHIYGVSEGQWGLLPGSARRRLCRRVNGPTRHRSDALEPQEGPRNVGRTGTPPRTSDNSAWMG